RASPLFGATGLERVQDGFRPLPLRQRLHVLIAERRLQLATDQEAASDLRRGVDDANAEQTRLVRGLRGKFHNQLGARLPPAIDVQADARLGYVAHAGLAALGQAAGRGVTDDAQTARIAGRATTVRCG